MLVGLGLIIVVAGVFLLIFHAIRAPGYGILAGVLAGTLLGPSILGRAMPNRYDQWIGGGAAERAALLSRERADATMIAQRGGSLDDRETLAADLAADRRPLERAWNDASMQDQLVHRVAAAIGVIIVAGVGLRMRRVRGGVIEAASMAAGLAAVVAGVMVSALVLWWEIGFGLALIATAGMLVGPLRMTPGDAAIADDAEHGGAARLDTTAMLATVFGLVTLSVGLWHVGQRGAALAWLTPLVLLLLPRSRGERHLLGEAGVALITALAMVRVDLFTDVWPLLIVLAMLVAGDGRWIGAVIGLLALGGRRSLRAMRVTLPIADCGSAQVAAGGLLGVLGIIPGHLTFALIVAAWWLELMRPLRGRIAASLIETERELEQMED